MDGLDMKIFVIPSWYPSEAFPSSGIFFKEQSQLMARHRPDWKVGISTWGSHDPKYWMRASRPLDAFTKYYSRLKIRQYEYLLEPNCVELLYPAFTWTRKVRNGNMSGIMEANEKNLKRFILHFGKPDVIHAHVAYPAGYIAAQLSQKHKIPFVVTEHMSPFPMPSLKGILKRRLIPTLKSANQVLGVSKNLVAALVQHGVEAKHSSNFIDDDFFAPAKNKQSNPHFVFLAIGRLNPQKDFSTLIKAAHLLQERGQNFNIKIIGEGAERSNLLREVKQLQIENNMEFLGVCDRTQVRDELRNCDALVMSSKHENQPVAILEALACGKPVVSTRWKGVEELIKTEVGQLCEVGNAVDLAEKMQYLTRNPIEQQSVRAYFDEHFSTKSAVDDLEQVYRSVI